MSHNALLTWCKDAAAAEGVAVSNFTTSFADGRAFVAILYHYLGARVPRSKLESMDALARLKSVFQLAESLADIAQLLDAEDMLILPKPDRLSVITYLSLWPAKLDANSRSMVAVGSFAGKLPGQSKPKSGCGSDGRSIFGGKRSASKSAQKASQLSSNGRQQPQRTPAFGNGGNNGSVVQQRAVEYGQQSQRTPAFGNGGKNGSIAQQRAAEYDQQQTRTGRTHHRPAPAPPALNRSAKPKNYAPPHQLGAPPLLNRSAKPKDYAPPRQLGPPHQLGAPPLLNRSAKPKDYVPSIR
jgi:Calponin homology (CH) domain